MYRHRKVTVIIPALDEAEAIARVVRDLSKLSVCKQCTKVVLNTTRLNARDGSTSNITKLSRNVECCLGDCTHLRAPLIDDIIVCDNGSTDDTAAIARMCGAIVVSEPERGYGAACLAALAAPVKKDLIVFVDADNSVVADELPLLIDPLCEGDHLVIGSRTLGNCEKGALSVPQRFGNRLASALMNVLWRAKVTDLGPFRAVTNDALTAIAMTDRQFGWTVEMQVRALQLAFKTSEVPVSTLRRIGKSKISGTVAGVIGAGHGILGTIAKLYWRQLTMAPKLKGNNDSSASGTEVIETRQSVSSDHR